MFLSILAQLQEMADKLAEGCLDEAGDRTTERLWMSSPLVAIARSQSRYTTMDSRGL